MKYERQGFFTGPLLPHKQEPFSLLAHLNEEIKTKSFKNMLVHKFIKSDV